MDIVPEFIIAKRRPGPDRQLTAAPIGPISIQDTQFRAMVHQVAVAFCNNDDI